MVPRWTITSRCLPGLPRGRIYLAPCWKRSRFRLRRVCHRLSVAAPLGAASALKRLETSELQAFERLQGAFARGNPLEIREARENWLRISEALRKYDLLVEQSRRDAGELVPGL
jgi:hypothetical protein